MVFIFLFGCGVKGDPHSFVENYKDIHLSPDKNQIHQNYKSTRRRRQ